MKSEKFYTSYSKLSEIKLITIGLASTELIKYWAEKTLPNGKVLGEVINANTLHHKTFKPLKGGLFCERIFGPLKDFECACGKPLRYKKEKTVFSPVKNISINQFNQAGVSEEIDRLTPLWGRSFPERENEGIFSEEDGRDLKLNKIYNKTNSIFGVISSKTRNYCPTCDVEYTWSVIRRYQLGYINLIAPVTHIWYLKGTPSYLSILLDFKKRDLVAITYCTSTLTIENILKGSIPTLKSGDIVSSWKNLKKQMIKTNDLNLVFVPKTKQGVVFDSINKTPFNKLKEASPPQRDSIASERTLLVCSKTSNPIFFPSLGEREGRDEPKGITQNKQIIEYKINSRKMLKLAKNFGSVCKGNLQETELIFETKQTHSLPLKGDTKGLLVLHPLEKKGRSEPLKGLFVPFREGTNQTKKEGTLFQNPMDDNKKQYQSVINFSKLKILSKLFIELKQNSLKFNILSANGFFPKEIFKKSTVNHYILLYLNIFSENKIWSQSLEIAWHFLVKKAYKTTFLRIQQMSTKLDYLQLKQNPIFNSFISSEGTPSSRTLFSDFVPRPLSGKDFVPRPPFSSFRGRGGTNPRENKLKTGKKFSNYPESKGSVFQLWLYSLPHSLKNEFVLKRKEANQSPKPSQNKKIQKLKKVFINLIVSSFKKGIHSSEGFPFLEEQKNSFSYSNESIKEREYENRGFVLPFREGLCSRTLFQDPFQGRNESKKVTNSLNEFLSFQSIELYTLARYSSSKIYYLLAKMLSRSLLKKLNFLFDVNNFTLTTDDSTTSNNIEKIDFLRKSDFFKNKPFSLKQESYLNVKSQQKQSLFKYLELFNNLIKLFLDNLLNDGSFKSTIFQRYFEYSVSHSFLPSIVTLREKSTFFPSFSSEGTPWNKREGTNNPFSLGSFREQNIKPNLETFLSQMKIFVSIVQHFGSLREEYLYQIPSLFLKEVRSDPSPSSSPSSERTKRGSWNKPEGTGYGDKREIEKIEKSGEPELNFKKIRNKIPVNKQNNKLYNNFYCLSYRELWSNDNDWNILYYYLSSATDNSKMVIPNYQIRYPNWGSFASLSGKEGTPKGGLGTKSFPERGLGTKSENKVRDEGINPNLSPLFWKEDKQGFVSNKVVVRSFPERETSKINDGRKQSFLQKDCFFSGSSLIQKLLTEYTVDEIKQMDKQNRILLYQLNKQIIKIKIQIKKKADKSLKKELKKYYKKRDSLIRRTKIVRKIFRKESSPESLILNVLPVLPPDLRPIVKMGNQIAASDLNRLYQRIIYRNERLKNFLKDSATSNSFEMKYAQRLLQEAVDNLIQNGKSGNGSEKDSRGRLLKSLSDILKGKQGRFRQYLLGKRVDYSGRSVIVVGPKLKLHECGLPKEIALELYLPFLLKRMLNQNLARTIIGAKTLIKTNPDLIYQLLREIMQTAPILLNRAPTLHRLGIQAFQPILIEGRAILLHPLVCSAFNADFDGDQMAVHVPITVEARAEAWKLMLSRNNILAPSTGDPLAIPSQDMVLGCYYLTTNLLNSKINYYSKKMGSGLFFTKINHVEKAYELKKLDLHANIWLKWSGLVENGLDQEEPLEIRIDSSGKWKEILNKYQKNYSYTNVLQNTFILTTVGRVLFNIKIQNCLYLD